MALLRLLMVGSFAMALGAETSGASLPCGGLAVGGLGSLAVETFAHVSSIAELQAAIFSLHGRRTDPSWPNHTLPTLQRFLEHDLEPQVSRDFWKRVLPLILEWASRIAELFAPALVVPYLCGNTSGVSEGAALRTQQLQDGFIDYISLSREQVASLLSHAFLCTIPGRDRLDDLPGFAPFSFLQLFAGEYAEFKSAKLSMLLQYFSELPPPPSPSASQRCHEEAPKLRLWRRVVTETPQWASLDAALPSFVVDWEEGGLERCEHSVQVGMSNRYPGGAPGGVLATGKMQEPIFFAERPELLVSLLLSERLGPNEALVIGGARQFGASVGVGPEVRAVEGGASEEQREVAKTQDMMQVDAIDFRKPEAPPQFSRQAVDRELLKLYAGHSAATQRRPAECRKSVDATGNWCCDAFGGDKQLKAVLQLISAGAAGLAELKLYPYAYPWMPTNRTDLPPLELPESLKTVQGLYRALMSFVDAPGDEHAKEGKLFDYLNKFSHATLYQ